MWLVMLNEIQRFFHGDNIYTTNLVFVCHTIYLASNSHEFGPECCCNELCICHICHTMNHIYKQVVKNRNNIKTRKKVKVHNLFNLLSLRTDGFVLCLSCIGLGLGCMWMWQLLQYFFRPKRWNRVAQRLAINFSSRQNTWIHIFITKNSLPNLFQACPMHISKFSNTRKDTSNCCSVLRV